MIILICIECLLLIQNPCKRGGLHCGIVERTENEKEGITTVCYVCTYTGRCHAPPVACIKRRELNDMNDVLHSFVNIVHGEKRRIESVMENRRGSSTAVTTNMQQDNYHQVVSASSEG